jgi:hypothetical protein
MGFAAYIAPHLVEFRAEPTTHFQRIRTPYLYLDVLWVEVPQHRVIHLLLRCGKVILASEFG